MRLRLVGALRAFVLLELCWVCNRVLSDDVSWHYSLRVCERSHDKLDGVS
jgi:hypothetical protein